MALGIVMVGAYLLGSFPTAYLVTRAGKGVDIRQHGSGNAGATNVARVVGKVAGIAVLAIDVAKGWLAVAWWPQTCSRMGWLGTGDAAATEQTLAAAGLSVIAGHIWSCFLRGRGGKGVATSAGVLLGVSPISCAIAIATWVVTVAVTRIVSVASIIAALTIPPIMLLAAEPPLLVMMSAVASVLIIGKHLSNLRRLFRREEPRLW